MTIEEMQEKKIELGFTNQILADNSGVPLGTVQKIMAGVTAAPRKKTLDALEKALEEGEKAKLEAEEKERQQLEAQIKEESSDHVSMEELASANELKDKAVNYSASRKGYTIDDYVSLPDDKRVELIDGTFYDMSATTHVHQMIVSALWKVFDNYIEKTEDSCAAIASLVDVQLDSDEWTVVQPDVMVICDRKKFQKNGRILGAPDLIVEVLSPSTESKDKFLKYYKYGNAGVREYWIVDIEKQAIKVDHFESDKLTSLYSFNDQIPVGIWNGQCVVDFKKIYSKIKFLLEG